MKSSYSSRMLPSAAETNKSTNRRPSVKSGKNVIQQYANQTKPISYGTNTSSYQTETRRTSLIDSSREMTVSNIIVQESYQPSQYTQSLDQKCRHYQSINRQDIDEQELNFDQLKLNDNMKQRVSEQSNPRQFNKYKSVPPQVPKNPLKQHEIIKIKQQVDMMKSKIIAKDLQLSNIMQMHQSQVNSLTEKDQFQKNTLIKQIHNNHIQIQRLQDSYKILQSDKQNISIYLREKEERINELEKELQMVRKQKVSIQEEYASVNETKKMLRVVDSQLEELIEDKKAKMRQLENNKNTIKEQSVQIGVLKDKILELNKEIKQYQNRQNKNIQDLQQQVKKYKQQSIKLGRQLLKIPDLQLKLKQSLVSSEEYRSRISQLVQNNDRMNVQLMSGSGTERKIDDLQWQLGRLRKTLIQTQGQLSKVKGQFQQNKRQQLNNQLNRQIKQLISSIQSQSKQIQELKSTVRQNEHIKILKQKQIEKYQEQISKLRDRLQSMDEMYKQNKNLTTKLKQKICTVQRLQLLINDYEHKLRLYDEQYNEKQLQTERILSHTKQLQDKYYNIEQQYNTIKQQKQSMTSRYQDTKTQLDTKLKLVHNMKQQINNIKQSKSKQQKYHMEEIKSFENKYNQLMFAKKELESNIEKEKEKYLVLRRKSDNNNQIIITLNQEAVNKEDIIKTQTNNVIRLNGDVKQLKEQYNKLSMELQKMSKWKEMYKNHMKQYQDLKNQMMRTAFSLNQK